MSEHPPDLDPRRQILGFSPTTVAIAVLAALGIAVVAVALLFDSATPGGRVGGDFPAFYAAGSIVLDGDSAQLYDPERQAAEQAELLGGEDGVLAYVNPPAFALLYAPLAALPYEVAYLIHTALMALLVVIAFYVVRPMLPRPLPPTPVVAAVAFTFVPLLGVAGGQNTAITILCIAVAWRATAADHEWLAGVALGFLLFKPQYAVPLIGLFLIRRHLRAVAVSVGLAVVWWATGAYMLGVGWLTDWIGVLGEFNAMDADVNAANAVSWLGLAENAFGVGSGASLATAAALVALTAALLIWAWLDRQDASLPLQVAAASAGILLTSPHAMFYDAGVLVLSVAGLAIAGRPAMRRMISGVWLLGLVHALISDLIGYSPVAIAVVWCFAAGLWRWFAVARPSAETRVVETGPGRIPDADLSIIVPAYNEAGRIEPTMARISEWSSDTGLVVETLVVDDGSTDRTAGAIDVETVRLLRLAENRGKGYAVRIGMLAASGRWRAFLDADGSTDPAELEKLLLTLRPVAIGSVAVADSEVATPQSGIRSSAGRFGNRIIQRLVLPGIEDSQRGAKLFEGDLAERVFSQCRIDRWGFDVEVLARCRSLGQEPAEVGIRWEDRPVGHVRPWHYLTTIFEVLRIRALVGKQDPVEPRAETATGATRPDAPQAP